jgi:hypothetical protein
MMFIINLLKLLLTKKEIKMNLGRWKIDYCNKKINRKIDMSNTDHCGPCGIDKLVKK